MKKILTFAIALIATVTASAEGWYAGGSVAFNRDITDNETEFIIMPEIGYNLTEKVAIGGVLGYDHTYDNGIKLNLFKVAPYLRYTYFKSGIVNLFVDGGVEFGTGKAKFDGESSDAANVWGIGIKPGVSLNVSKNVSLIAHIGFLGYQGANDEAKSAGQPEKFGIGLNGNDISIGFYYNF